MSASHAHKIEVARQYFRLSDAGDRKLLDLFHEDATIYFPKFGIGYGRASILDVVRGFQGTLESIRHDVEGLLFIPSGAFVVVEGMSAGRMAGGAWKGGETPGGRFCNVFEFRGDRISRLHVYLDPDYLGEDAPRFHWGRDGRRW